MAAPFNAQALTNAVQTLPVLTADLPASPGIYHLSDEVEYIPYLQDERMNDSVLWRKGILFRPDVAARLQNLVLEALTGPVPNGIMIRGPQGIGKSHTLISLVETLRNQGHIVTFIPDCEKWDGATFFAEAICRSLGTTMEGLSLTLGDTEFQQGERCEALIQAIADILASVNKTRQDLKQAPIYWILVFDQLNRIFARKEHLSLKDMGVLPRPFKFMKRVLQFKYVTSIVSASANNSIAYKENHRGFLAFDHETRMTVEEIKLWSRECADMLDAEIDNLLEATGGVPLQVSIYLEDPVNYMEAAVNDVLDDITKLIEEAGSQDIIDSITNNAVNVLLQGAMNMADRRFDKKYSVQRQGYLLETFPAVLVAYRIKFWKPLMAKVKRSEADLLRVCCMAEVTNDVRGRLFELIVISRCQTKAISIGIELGDGVGKDVLPVSVDAGRWFEGLNLPLPSSMASNSLHVPINSNFPAIDMIWTAGRDVWGVQIHVKDHDDCLPGFTEMCKRSGWLKGFDNIYLLYLSPDPAVMNLLTCLPVKSIREKKPRLAKETETKIQVSAASKNEISCLQNLQWETNWSIGN